ncbi:MAG: PQQ-binding-like beta-propeller repeat protein [Actinomycetota bacterium]
MALSILATAPRAWAAVGVSGFSPTRGPVGTTVSISGSGFTGTGGSCSGVTIKFNGVVATCTYISATRISTKVPPLAGTGPLTVNGASSSNPPTSFSVTLGISLTPVVGPPTTNVTVAGSGFGPTERVDLYVDTAAVGLVTTDATGGFAGSRVRIPGTAVPGPHWLTAVGRHSGLATQRSFTVATTWAQFQFDAGHTGFNRYENVIGPDNVADLVPAWTASLGAYLDASQPTVAPTVGAHGTLFVGDGGGILHALDPATGSTLWKSASLGSAIRSSPAYSAGADKVFVTDAAGDLLAYPTRCVTPCSPAWQSGAGGAANAATGSPALVGSSVFVADTVHGVAAYPTACPATCSPSWVGNGMAAIAGTSATVADGLVDVHTHDFSIFCLCDVHEFDFYASAGCGGSSCGGSTPGAAPAPFGTSAAARGGVVYYSVVGQLAAYDVRSGFQGLWEHSGNVVMPALARGVVFGGARTGVGTGQMLAVRASDGSTLWQASIGEPYMSSTAVVANGVVYTTTSDNDLRAFPVSCSATCAPLWTVKVSNTGYASVPTVVNGMLYEASGDGHLYAFSLASDAAERFRPPQRPDPRLLEH